VFKNDRNNEAEEKDSVDSDIRSIDEKMMEKEVKIEKLR
jgi:hypothetical protein